jgi:rRNA-processing protein FCF1
MLYCFLDTNIFLHFESFDNIDWLDELNAKEVTIAISIQVINELDKWKREPKHAKKAEAAGKKIKLYKDGKPVRDGVYLRIVDEPFIQWLRENGFDHENPDSRIIGTIRKFADDNLNDEVIAVSDDINFQIRVEAKGLRYAELNEKYKLPIQLSPEAEELRTTRRELDLLKNAQPKLSLYFLGDKGEVNTSPVFEYTVDFNEEGLSREAIDNLYNQERAELNGEISFHESFSAMFTSFNRQQYVESAREYLEEYRVYLRENSDYEVRVKRMRKLVFLLKNTGQKPAENLDIQVEFLGKVSIFEDFPQRPEAPQRPRSPQTFVEKALNPLFDKGFELALASLSRSQSVNFERELCYISIDENTRAITGHNDNLKHGLSWKWSVVVEFDVEESYPLIIPIKYHFNVDNPSIMPFDGQLTLKITKIE